MKVEKASSDLQEQYGPFFENAISRMSQFDKDLEEIERLRKNLAEYLVEDLAKFKLEECIATFAQFTEQVINFYI